MDGLSMFRSNSPVVEALRSTRSWFQDEPGRWRKGGWWQRGRNGGLQLCVMGAVSRSIAGEDLAWDAGRHSKVFGEVQSVLNMVATQRGFANAINWNDNPYGAKDQDDVIAFLDEAIALVSPSPAVAQEDLPSWYRTPPTFTPTCDHEPLVETVPTVNTLTAPTPQSTPTVETRELVTV